MEVIKLLNTVSCMEISSCIQKCGHDISKHNYILSKILIESAQWSSELSFLCISSLIKQPPFPRPSNSKPSLYIKYISTYLRKDAFNTVPKNTFLVPCCIYYGFKKALLAYLILSPLPQTEQCAVDNSYRVWF
jgi:hypothetical protein